MNSHSEATSFSPPSINESGHAAFVGVLTSGEVGIFITDGEEPTLVDVTDANHTSFSSTVSISQNSRIAYQTGYAPAGAGIFTTNSNSAPKMVVQTGSTIFDLPHVPGIDRNGKRLVVRVESTGGGDSIQVFDRDGQSRDVVADNGPLSIFADFQAALPVIGGPSKIAFRADCKDGTSGIFLANEHTIKTVADSRGDLELFAIGNMNANGTVIFWTRTDQGDEALYTGDGKHLHRIADTGDDFIAFGPGECTIADDGQVAFLAFTSDGAGIFSGPDPIADRIIGVGDSLDDSTIVGLRFGRNGLNNRGQIAFVALLEDGSQGVYIANVD